MADRREDPDRLRSPVKPVGDSRKGDDDVGVERYSRHSPRSSSR
jgi:hypothetical protein